MEPPYAYITAQPSRRTFPWRLILLVLASIGLHSYVLVQFNLPHFSQPNLDLEQLQIELLPPPEMNTPPKAGIPAEPKKTIPPVPLKNTQPPLEAAAPKFEQLPSSAQLLQNSYEITRSLTGQTDDTHFHRPSIAPGMEYLTDTSQAPPPEIIESYALPNGNKKVAIRTPWGSVQCFEVPKENPLETFSANTWMFSRC